MMTAERSPFDWNAWLWWLSLTAMATIAAMTFIFFLVFNIGVQAIGTFSDGQSSSIALQVAIAPIFAVAGAIVGFGQWLVLRGLFHRAGWWILATAGGWMAGYLWSFLLIPPDIDVSSIGIALLPWALNGLGAGLCQWLVLRRHYDRSALWIPTATLAVIIGMTGWLIGGTFGGAFLWLLAGGFSGWVLQKVLQPKRLWPEQRGTTTGDQG